jgi:hypothetical protein
MCCSVAEPPCSSATPSKGATTRCQRAESAVVAPLPPAHASSAAGTIEGNISNACLSSGVPRDSHGGRRAPMAAAAAAAEAAAAGCEGLGWSWMLRRARAMEKAQPGSLRSSPSIASSRSPARGGKVEAHMARGSRRGPWEEPPALCGWRCVSDGACSARGGCVRQCRAAVLCGGAVRRCRAACVAAVPCAVRCGGGGSVAHRACAADRRAWRARRAVAACASGRSCGRATA